MKRRPELLGGPAGAASEAAYRAAIRIRNRLYDAGLLRARRAPVPVASVGNLTAGGTGKTPIVIELAALLLAEGRRPALVTRGYGRRGARKPVVLPPGTLPGPGDHLRWGDEPCLFRLRQPEVPIVLDRDRARGAIAAVRRFGADTILLDDGMQHRRLRRDLEIVLVHGLEPFGNGRLLPRGLLREPAESIRRADAVFIQATEGTRPDIDRVLDAAGAPGARVRFTYEPIALRAPGGEVLDPRAFLRGKRVLAASGIGRPESFERLLESCGAEVAGRLRFPDHHRFAPPDRARIREEAARIGAIAVTTEKDRCRLTEEETRRAELHVLEVRPRFDDPGGIVAALLVRLRGGSL